DHDRGRRERAPRNRRPPPPLDAPRRSLPRPASRRRPKEPLLPARVRRARSLSHGGGGQRDSRADPPAAPRADRRGDPVSEPAPLAQVPENLSQDSSVGPEIRGVSVLGIDKLIRLTIVNVTSLGEPALLAQVHREPVPR